MPQPLPPSPRLRPWQRVVLPAGMRGHSLTSRCLAMAAGDPERALDLAIEVTRRIRNGDV